MKYKLHSYAGYPGKLTDRFMPDLRPIKRGRYKLHGNYTVKVIDEDKFIYYVTVPDGFVNDGASVPRIFWTISGLTRDGLIRAGALIHDWLYRRNGKLETLTISRKDSDKIFYDLMRAAGISGYRAWIAYKAVRVFARRF